MKSLGSGNYGSKFFKELALDYGLPHRADLLSKSGIKSKHNRLLYAVGMLALACFLILAIWATGSSMHAPDNSGARSGQHIRMFGPHPGLAAEDASDAPTDSTTVMDQEASKAAGNSSDHISSSSKEGQAAGSTERQGQQEQASNSTAAASVGSGSASAANAPDKAPGPGGTTPAAVGQATEQQQQPQAATSPAAGAKQGSGNAATASSAAAKTNSTAEGH